MMWNGQIYGVLPNLLLEEVRGIGSIDRHLYTAIVNRIGGVRWGYIDKTGWMVIAPQYDWANEFQQNGLAVVSKDDWTGAIDGSGQYVILPRYRGINDFYEGRAIAYTDHSAILIDEQGNELFKTKGYIGNMQEARAVFSPGGEEWKYGYIDHMGNIVIPPIFKSANHFVGGRAVVGVEDGTYALIDPSGTIITHFPYAYVGELGEGLLPFKKTMEDKYGYIDTSSNVVIPPQFEGAGQFQNGRAVVTAYEQYMPKYGLIDRSGKIIIPLQYNDIRLIGENRAAVGVPIHPENSFGGSRYAIADLDGRMLTDFIYYDITKYDNRYYEKACASANDGKTTFFIDSSGRRVEKLPMVKGAGSLIFSNGLIRASVDRRIMYVDLSGRIIWKEDRTLPIDRSYIVKEEKYMPTRSYLVYYPRIEGIKNPIVQQTVNEKLKTLAGAEGIEEGAVLEYSYDGDFIVKFFRKQLVVIRIDGYHYPFGAAHGMPTQIYTHIDLITGQFYELKDLFRAGEDYVKRLSSIIKKQIKEQGEDSYIWPDAFKEIKEDQPFFITENALHIYFTPYEIAPYAAGFPTFTIPFDEIKDIVAFDGDFWRSFH